MASDNSDLDTQLARVLDAARVAALHFDAAGFTAALQGLDDWHGQLQAQGAGAPKLEAFRGRLLQHKNLCAFLMETLGAAARASSPADPRYGASGTLTNEQTAGLLRRYG